MPRLARQDRNGPVRLRDIDKIQFPKHGPIGPAEKDLPQLIVSPNAPANAEASLRTNRDKQVPGTTLTMK
ncbi:MAG: hypothetical protein ACI87O_002377 [Planctomycetota bacterium]|jgi:hypothetical protein